MQILYFVTYVKDDIYVNFVIHVNKKYETVCKI